MKEADIKIDDLEKEETKSEKKSNAEKEKEKNQEAVNKWMWALRCQGK